MCLRILVKVGFMVLSLYKNGPDFLDEVVVNFRQLFLIQIHHIFNLIYFSILLLPVWFPRPLSDSFRSVQNLSGSVDSCLNRSIFFFFNSVFLSLFIFLLVFFLAKEKFFRPLSLCSELPFYISLFLSHPLSFSIFFFSV